MAHIRDLVHERNGPLPSIATLLADAPPPQIPPSSFPMPPSGPFTLPPPHHYQTATSAARPPPLLHTRDVPSFAAPQHAPPPPDPSALLLRAIDAMETKRDEAPSSPPKCRVFPLPFYTATPPDSASPVSPTAVLPAQAHAHAHAPHPASTSDGTLRERGRVRKGPWRPAETALLQRLVEERGACNWAAIATHIPGRNGKQARERWKNHLDPRLKKSRWSALEDAALYEHYCRLGNKWSAIARKLPGRSDNDVKNRFNGAIRPRIAAGNPPTLPPDYTLALAPPAPPPRVASQAHNAPPDMFTLYD